MQLFQDCRRKLKASNELEKVYNLDVAVFADFFGISRVCGSDVQGGNEFHFLPIAGNNDLFIRAENFRKDSVRTRLDQPPTRILDGRLIGDISCSLQRNNGNDTIPQFAETDIAHRPFVHNVLGLCDVCRDIFALELANNGLDIFRRTVIHGDVLQS